MQKETDSRIQAKVRILLARRWVDLQSVTIGTTNGVVYIGGSLTTTGRPPAANDATGSAHETPPRWFQRIRREISEIPEVRDVVFLLGSTGSTGGTCQQRPF